MAVDRYVGGAGIVWRRFDQTDAAPIGEVDILRRNVGPIFSFIAGDLDQAVVRSRPDQAFREGRGSDCENGVVIFGAGVVDCDRAT